MNEPNLGTEASARSSPAGPAELATGDFSERPPVTPGDGPASVLASGAVIAGRYTLLEVIGEGGMGSVYLASQTVPVKRQVALKLIRTGMDSRGVLARFDAERQALALMDHPNIARIYDGGVTPSGQPFFVMELVRGAPLTEYCDSRRLSVDARLQLFVAVCQAVQHAHQKGIIHRDLKPGNVLVTEVDGRPTPKVIDFGVAKATELKLTDVSFADTGAIVGTPAYMSPEQADPSSMDIDTRTDVYALGVMLYELLAGSPPIDARQFKRGAILEMLRMVREVEPPRPSTRLSSADALPNIAANRNIEPARLAKLLQGELDWVVMKALEKDRARRYESANSFAEDIRRYLADEVVEARPPSRGYRLRKLVKRNKARVLAAALVLVALVGGIIGTTWQAIRADEAAEQARLREADAVTARNDAVSAANEAVAARNDEKTANGKLVESQRDLLQSNDRLVTGVARSLLRPLAAQIQPGQPPPPLNEHEIETLWELAATPEGRLRLRFVEEALNDPLTARRLRERSIHALHADIGLDPAMRAQVEDALGRRLLAGKLPPEEQEHLAVCLAAMGVRDRTLALAAAAVIARAIAGTANENALKSLAQALSAVTARLGPADAAESCGPAALALVRAMAGSSDVNALRARSQALSAFAPGLDSKGAADSAALLIPAMSGTVNEFMRISMAEALAALAAGLKPDDAARLYAPAAAALLPTMQAVARNNPFNFRLLAKTLSAVAARLEPKDVARLLPPTAIALAQAIAKSEHNAASILAEYLSGFAGRLDPRDAAAACGPAALALLQAMDRPENQAALRNLALGMSAVASRLEPNDAARVCGTAAATLTEAMQKTGNPGVMQSLVQGLSAVAPQLEPADAARGWERAAAAHTRAMDGTMDGNALIGLAQGLSAVAARMEPKAAARVCGPAVVALTESIGKPVNEAALMNQARRLAALSERLDPGDSARAIAVAAAALIQAMKNTSDPDAFRFLSIGLSAAGARLEPEAAARAAAALTRAMAMTASLGGSRGGTSLQFLSSALSAVATRLGPDAAAEAAETLSQAMGKAPDESVLRYLAAGLAAVAARLEPKQAAAAATALTLALAKTTNSSQLPILAESLAKVAARLEPKHSSRVCGNAAAVLIKAMNSPESQSSLMFLAEGLSKLAAGMNPEDAARACGPAAATLMTQITGKAASDNAIQPLTRGLAAALARMDSADARQRLLGVTSSFGAAGDSRIPFTAGAFAPAVPEPLPAQTLVDLLKHPFCVGEARRLVLEQLSRHYRRPFADQWEFMEHARDAGLPLDLRSPPVRQKKNPGG